MAYTLKFLTPDEELNQKYFNYDGSMTIQNMLNDFLIKTNSKITLNEEAILFQFNAHILNKGENLSKTVADIFKKNKINTQIKVYDYKNVIGGIINNTFNNKIKF